MSPVIEDSIIINLHMLGVFFSGTMIGTVVLFGFIYYYYVNRTRVYFIASAFFLGVFLRVFTTAFIDLKEIMGAMVDYNMSLIHTINLLGSLFAVYMTVYFSVEIIRIKVYMAKSLGIVLLILTMVLYRPFGTDYEALYMFSLIHILIVFLTGMIEFIYNRDEALPVKRYMSFFGIQLMMIFIVYHATMTDYLYNLEWAIVSALAIALVAFFIWDYKKIYSLRNGLYLKLVFDEDTLCYSKNFILERFESIPKGTVIFIDFNQFKWINDTFGHVVGDTLIAAFTHRLVPSLSNKMTLGRFGGDEFIILVEDGSVEAAKGLAQTVIKAFKSAVESLQLKGNNPLLGVSIGIANFDAVQRDGVHLADLAMYESKSRGNNQVTVVGGDQDE